MSSKPKHNLYSCTCTFLHTRQLNSLPSFGILIAHRHATLTPIALLRALLLPAELSRAQLLPRAPPHLRLVRAHELLVLDHRRAHEDAERGERRVQDEHRVRAARVAVQDAARRRGGDVDRVGVRGRRAGTVGLIAIGEGGEHGRVVDDLVDRGGRKPEGGHTCPERVVAGYNIEISYLRAKSDERLAPEDSFLDFISNSHDRTTYGKG